MRSPKSLIAAGLLLFFLGTLPGPCGAEELGVREILSWLSAAEEAAPYRGDVRYGAIFEKAKDEGVPLILLFEKLKEGIAKRISPPVLVRFLGEEGLRLALARSLVSSSSVEVRGSEEELALLKSCSISLSNGIDRAVLKEVLRAAALSRKGATGAVGFLPVLIRMREVGEIPSELAGPFASAVFSGRLPETEYGPLVSLYFKAVAGRLSTETTLKLMIDTLKTGGGIIQIERELSRRIRRP